MKIAKKYRIKFIIFPLILGFILFSSSFANAQKYKRMMYDNSVNFYEVVKEAEKYFNGLSKEEKSAKGSGWKGYQRWLYNNEFKYYPSGDRSGVDPFFISKSFKKNKKEHLEVSQKLAAQGKMLNTTGWEDLGPYYVGQVTGHYAVGLGRVETFYVDPNNDQRIYLGSRSGGFWKTLDGGTTWSGGSTDFLDASGVNTMAVSPTNPANILINVNNSQNQLSHGIYRSNDSGDNWSITNFNPSNLGWGGLGSDGRIYQIQYHPTTPNMVFVGTNKGLFRSTDDLATWTKVANYWVTSILFHPTNPDIIYATKRTDANNILVSTNGGATFSQKAFTGNTSEKLHLSVSADCPNCVFLSTSDGIWKSMDSGNTFSKVSTPGIGNYGGFVVCDTNSDDILLGSIDTHMSTDGGINFTKRTNWGQGNANYKNNSKYVHADNRVAKSINGVFWIGTDGFLCKSTDKGINWERFEGQGIRENYALGVSQSNSDRTITGSQDNGTSIKTETGWVEFYGGDGMEGIIHPLNDDWMIGSYQEGGRRKTQDGGITQSNATPAGQTGAWVAPLAYDPNNHMRVYHFGSNVYRSEDFGSTWTNVGAPNFTGVIWNAAIAQNNSQIMVVTKGVNIEKSTDGGATFNSIRSNLPNYQITDVAFDPNDDNVIVVTYGRYHDDNAKVYITTNQGVSWSNITYNLNNMPIRSVVIDHTDASNIYLGAEIGVYKKAMADNTWTLYNPGLPNTSINELEIVYGSNTLRGVSWGRGMWQHPLDGRASYPAIVETQITQQPTENLPIVDVDQYVTSTITYNGTLTNVYVAWSKDNPTFENTIPMSNISGDVWESNTPIPNYPEGTKVYFKVYAEGANSDISETYKFMYTVKPLSYCSASGTSGTGGDYINRVQLGNFENGSGQSLYSNYDNLGPIAIETGQQYTLEIELAAVFSPDKAGAWIDFNRDGDFDDPNEAISMSAYSNRVSTGTFTVPASALTDIPLKLRTRNTYNASVLPCGNAFGEVEDYLVTVSSPLSIDDTKILDNIVYPNPVSQTLYIEYSSVNNEPVEAFLYSATGQLVRKGKLGQYKYGSKSFDVSSLLDGLYFLRMKNSQGLFLKTKRVIIKN
ncbi:VPS10 domain-containing protein [Gaetbulibacter saemankumensis]|uniref:VPS10 domain-containing protein n=1 Tax=Gaetbulibacter saemankumensis TaxID=311208 RepID=UPI00048156DA|nr:GEVED domain-containing protein [Gaetbulibacter saemankumensis]